MEETLMEKVRNIITLQIENESDIPQDFQLLKADWNRADSNFGNPACIKITTPNPYSHYDVLMADTQTKGLGGIVITNLFCDKKRKFAFYKHKVIYQKSDGIELLGKIVALPIPVAGNFTKVIANGGVYIKPDGWKLQPKEKILVDLEIEFHAPVQEVVTKPTAFIKICIENKTNKPQKYSLFNANLNLGPSQYSRFEDSQDVAITWESNKDHYSSTGKDWKGREMEPRRQNYDDLLCAMKYNDLILRVVNVFSPQRDYFVFNTFSPDGSIGVTKLALPYPDAYRDKRIAGIVGSTSLAPCNLVLAPYEKTWIELEVEQD